MKVRQLFNKKSINYIAIIISALTLIAFIYQTSVISEQQRLSVYPHLMFNNQNGGSLNYSYTLSNKGIGPAIIEAFKVTDFKGRVYDDLALYLMDTLNQKYHGDFLISNVSTGQLISPGEKIELITFNNNRGFTQIRDSTKAEPIVISNRIYQLLNQDELLIEVIYKSVYEDSWKVSNKNKIPEEL